MLPKSNSWLARRFHAKIFSAGLICKPEGTSMGWVPLNAVVIKVVVDEHDRAPRFCRLHDRRDYAGLVEFVHRTQALSQHREYSFVFDVINEATASPVMHFVCLGTNHIVDSSASLSYAFETHSNSGSITLQVKFGPAKNHNLGLNGNHKESGIVTAESTNPYIPAGRILPDAQSPMATLKQGLQNHIDQTMAIPVAGSNPSLRSNVFRGENSPSTSANIGGLNPHPVHDCQLPEESVTRAGDDLTLKAYGHGMHSRQVRERQAS